jgi:hypothetical protein
MHRQRMTVPGAMGELLRLSLPSRYVVAVEPEQPRQERVQPGQRRRAAVWRRPRQNVRRNRAVPDDA